MLKNEVSNAMDLVTKLRRENGRLIDELELQKFNVRKTLDEWALDRTKRDDLLRKAIGYYQNRIKLFEDDLEVLMQMFGDELNVKDSIIEQINAVKDAFVEKTRRLIVKLRIPREHYLFLCQNGKLDEFVEAKLLDKEPEAKWLLMDAGKSQIDRIEYKQTHKFAGLRDRGMDIGDGGQLEVLKSPKA